MFAFFGNIFDPTFENDKHIFKETIMGAMWTNDLRMMMPVQHLPEYVHRTEVPQGHTSQRHWRVSVIFSL